MARNRLLTREQSIQTLFLQQKEFYSLAEAARIVGTSPGTLRREAEWDDREAYRVGGTWRFTWRHLAYIAMRRWTLSCGL